MVNCKCCVKATGIRCRNPAKYDDFCGVHKSTCHRLTPCEGQVEDRRKVEVEDKRKVKPAEDRSLRRPDSETRVDSLSEKSYSTPSGDDADIFEALAIELVDFSLEMISRVDFSDVVSNESQRQTVIDLAIRIKQAIDKLVKEFTVNEMMLVLTYQPGWEVPAKLYPLMDYYNDEPRSRTGSTGKSYFPSLKSRDCLLYTSRCV